MQTVDQYIADQPPQLQPALGKIRAIIQAEAPDAEEKMAWGIPSYRQGKYRFHFGVFEGYIGYYPEADARPVFGDQLAGYQTTKNSIRFPLDQPIPFDLIAEITRWRMSQVALAPEQPVARLERDEHGQPVAVSDQVVTDQVIYDLMEAHRK